MIYSLRPSKEQDLCKALLHPPGRKNEMRGMNKCGQLSWLHDWANSIKLFSKLTKMGGHHHIKGQQIPRQFRGEPPPQKKTFTQDLPIISSTILFPPPGCNIMKKAALSLSYTPIFHTPPNFFLPSLNISESTHTQKSFVHEGHVSCFDSS